jgi:DNA-binding LytR/AlgR family response regulator
MEILIIEDEKIAGDRLEKLILEFDDTYRILAKLRSVEDSLRWFSTNKIPDLVFSDIQLADGLAFSIFDTLKYDIPVIFITGHSDFAVKAFRYTSIDYLMKPVNKVSLTTALNKLKSFNKVFTKAEAISNAGVIITNDYKKRFMIRVGEVIHSIPVEDILIFFSKEKFSYLKTKDLKTYIIDYSLDQLESMVSPLNFFRVNRQYIITHHSIHNVVAHFNGKYKILLKDMKEEEVLISREKANVFKLWLDL